MIKDRGTIKWTAMMLPEHVQEIRGIWEQDKKVPERIVDEQQLELVNLTIERALIENILVSIIFYENDSYKKRTGHIKKVDSLACTISLQTTEQIITIPMKQILDAEEIV